MPGIGERMDARNSTYTDADGRMFYGDGTPVPPEVRRRLDARAAAWRRWEAGEDVPDEELFGPPAEQADDAV